MKLKHRARPVIDSLTEAPKGTFRVSGRIRGDKFDLTVGPFTEKPQNSYQGDLVAPVKGLVGEQKFSGEFSYKLCEIDPHASLECYGIFADDDDACEIIEMAIDDSPEFNRILRKYL